MRTALNKMVGDSLDSWLRGKFELSRGEHGRNVRTMEGLRGFAVFLVFLVHYVTLVEPWTSRDTGLRQIAGALHTMGNAGVDLFFVLSGFLIYGSLLSREQSIVRFFLRRIQRIYPAFVVVLAIYLALSFVFPAESKLPKDPYDAFVYLVQNFLLLPGIFPIQPLITVAWSLSYEMFYYLLVPVLVAGLKRASASPRARIAFFLAVATTAGVVSAFYGGPIRLVMFISGMVLYEAINNTDIPAPTAALGSGALVAGLLCTLLPVNGSLGAAIEVACLAVAFFVLCHACFCGGETWLARAFSWTPLRWLGNMSYSYYLLHGLALKAAFKVMESGLPAGDYGAWLFWVLLAPMFALTLVPTSALFLLVERPYSLVPRRMGRATTASASLQG